jgi:hypothetical protein
LSINLPIVASAADAAAAAAKALEGLANGDLTAGEAETFMRAAEAYTRLLLTQEFEERLAKLEEAAK